jgi:hypothetical protein
MSEKIGNWKAESGKTVLPATASEATPASERALPDSNRPQRAIKSVLRALLELCSLDGVTPGSRFQWIENFKVGVYPAAESGKTEGVLA